MNRIVRYHRLAEAELHGAAEYYDNASPGLREQFLTEVERNCALLSQHSELGVLVSKRVRRLVMRRFPYALFYSVREEEVRILAIGHHRRRPFYWSHRR